jgi:hypothetical protein
MGAATASLSAWRRARRLCLPSYIPSVAFARGVLDMMEPPARVLLGRVDHSTVPDAVRPALDAAYRSLTAASAAALSDALAASPAATEDSRRLAASIVGLAPPEPVQPLVDEVAGLPVDAPLRLALTGIVTRAGQDRDRIVTELAEWYDDTMDRLSGSYKRRVQRFLFVYALLLTLVLNLDAIALTNALWQNRSLRTAAIQAASSSPAPAIAVDTAPAGTQEEAAKRAVDAVRDAAALRLPLGWSGVGADRSDPRRIPGDPGGWALKIAGWLLTALALSLGAPFWFDLLGRLVNMRSSGPKPGPAAG